MPHSSCACQCHASSRGSERDADTVAYLDKEIKRVEDYAHALRCRRNALLPVARLPPEILCRIFDFHRTGCPPIDTMFNMIGVTQVCSTWRSTARSCASLWTVIHVGLPMLAQECMELAKPFPLSLWYEEDEESEDSLTVKQVFQLLPRCRSIHLSMGANRWRHTFTQLASIPLPYLRDLFMQDLQGSIYMKDFNIPGEHLAPNLSYIRFSGITTLPESLRGSNIRGLKLSGTASTRLLKLPTFIDILASLERLEILELEKSLPFVQRRDHLYTPVGAVRLPNLLLLTVHDSVYNMLTFLKNVIVGLCTKVSLTANNNQYDSIDLFILLERTLAKMDFTPRLPWPTVSISCTGKSLRLVVQREGPAAETSTPKLTIRLDLRDPNGDQVVILRSLFGMVPHMLTLRLAGNVIDMDWWGTERLKNLRTVEATGAVAIHVIQFLKKSSMEASAEEILWPGLCNLDISRGHHSPDDLRALEGALRLREKVVGRRLASLRVRASEVGKVGVDVADLVHGGPEGEKPADGHKAFSDEFSTRKKELVGI
jgi:hypothetical protein